MQFTLENETRGYLGLLWGYLGLLVFFVLANQSRQRHMFKPRWVGKNRTKSLGGWVGGWEKQNKGGWVGKIKELGWGKTKLI